MVPPSAHPAPNFPAHLWLLLEDVQFYCCWPLRQSWKCFWQVLNGTYLQTVQIQLYCAWFLLQTTQPQDDSMGFPISQLDVAKNHWVQPPITLQIAKYHWNKTQNDYQRVANNPCLIKKDPVEICNCSLDMVRINGMWTLKLPELLCDTPFVRNCCL